ncbi:hypothetical protein [Tessaracoccus antarcticus]|uniref:Uncharacterized protein n=1 Tax=Tessaracoccus antarcticus TaxID=2479848 RepID=A0A3M0GLJ3_9ACTN|nr:hypothetical protein [Tessaracoccus antarcticus]RMB62039.1 hypothetical protein EAX62_05490 [Tessaracoccus antarcticus]
MNEDEISETLDKVVPHRELPEGLLAGARRRRRRTRTLTGTAAAALVAALAVPLALTMGSSGQQVATPQPTAISTASYDEQCRVDAEGRMATSELPGDTLPDGPSAVWFCSGVVSRAPFEPLVGTQATQRLVDSFRELSTTPVEGKQRSLSPNKGYLVFTYADGQRYVVQIDLYSSGQVLWGSEQQHVRYGSPEWFYGLDQLWRRQRDENPQNPPLAPRVGVCDNMGPSLGRPMDRYDVDGALCTVIRNEAGVVEGVRVPAPQQLVTEARREAQSASVAWVRTDLEPNPAVHWDGDTIMLVDDYGDRLPLMQTATDKWFWQQGDKGWEWTPTPELAARLNKALDEGRPSPQPTHS